MLFLSLLAWIISTGCYPEWILKWMCSFCSLKLHEPIAYWSPIYLNFSAIQFDWHRAAWFLDSLMAVHLEKWLSHHVNPILLDCRLNYFDRFRVGGESQSVSESEIWPPGNVRKEFWSSRSHASETKKESKKTQTLKWPPFETLSFWDSLLLRLSQKLAEH